MLTISGVGSVILPTPEYGDTISLNLRTAVNTTVNGTPLIYKGDRVTYSTYSLAFTMVKEDVKEAFLTFVEDNAGYEITLKPNVILIDCDTGVRTSGGDQPVLGYIVTPKIDVITDRDGCSYSFAFDFMRTAGDVFTVFKYQERS